MKLSVPNPPAFPLQSVDGLHAYAYAKSMDVPDIGEDRNRAYQRARGEGAAGMSLRDHYAGIALGSDHCIGSPDQVAKQAYELADAMLKARLA